MNEDTNNGWTAKREVTLSKWKDTCKKYLEFHQTEQVKHAAAIRRMLIFHLFLSGIAIIFNGFVFLNDVTFVVGNICAAIINAILAGTHVYQKFEGSDAKLSLHESAIKVYKRLHHNMEKEFAQPLYERVSCEAFMKNVSMLLLDYEDDFEQPLLSLATASDKNNNIELTPAATSTATALDDCDSSSPSLVPGLPSPVLATASVSAESIEYGNCPDMDEEDDAILGFTEDQNARFGMFIRRASNRKHMVNYQVKRLGAK